MDKQNSRDLLIIIKGWGAIMLLSELFLQTGAVGIQKGIELAIIGFSIVLFTLSIVAYKTTGLKKLVYAAGAFALFSFQLFFE